MLIRIQKILAQAGFGSRRSCETFVTEGRVLVDGKVVQELGAKADPETQTVVLDGQKVAGPGKAAKTIREQQTKIYYALNKPKGVLCTNEDPSGRPLAIQIIPERRRIFCVGRLDKDTEGLLLLTNDGDMAQELTHPRYGVPKTYVAKVDGMVSGSQVEKLRAGVFLAEGRTKEAFVRIRKRGKKASALEVVINEGKNRQVRRILAAVGLKCRNLKRVKIGPIRMGNLGSGEFRTLSQAEIEALRESIARARGQAMKAEIPEAYRTRDKVDPGNRNAWTHAARPTPSRDGALRPWEKGEKQSRRGTGKPWPQKGGRFGKTCPPDARKRTDGDRRPFAKKRSFGDKQSYGQKKPFRDSHVYDKKSSQKQAWGKNTLER